MNNKILEKENEIEAARERHSRIIEGIENQLAAARQARDQEISRIMEERDAIALAEKLKEYPPELVQNHKTCSICGGLMRPFRVIQEEKVAKIWACQNGSLSDTHDKIYV